MTSVTLKMRARSPGSSTVFTLSWCFSVPNLVRIYFQIFLEILTGNHPSYVVALMTSVTWKTRSMSPNSNFVLRLVPVLQCTKFGEDMSNIYWDIEWKPSFMSSPWMTFVTLKVKSRSPSSNFIFGLPWCFCVPNLVRIDQIFLEILSRNHLAYHLSYISSPSMTPVTLKMRSMSLGSNLVFALSSVYQIWWGYVKYLLRYWAETIFHMSRP